jgi:Protein of unknown function (DUF616)
MSPKRAVFTALLGDYEELINQPTAESSKVDFICFTNNSDLRSTSWKLHPVDPILPLDMVRSQRALKIRGHEILAEYDEVLYIDNSVFLRQDPAVILDAWLENHDYAVARHSVRETVIDEFDQIIALHYDDPNRVNEQLLHYVELFPEVLFERPYWNGMSARRNTPEVAAMMSTWFDHVLRYSRRDQLSANVAFSLSGLQINAVESDNNDAATHQWPAGVHRKAHLTVAPRRRSGPLLAEIRKLHVELAQLHEHAEENVQLNLLKIERKKHIVRLTAQLAEMTSERDQFEARVKEIEASRTWRAAAPLRWVRGQMRPRSSDH